MSNFYRVVKATKRGKRYLSFTSNYTASGKMRVAWTQHGTRFCGLALAQSWANKYNGTVESIIRSKP